MLFDVMEGQEFSLYVLIKAADVRIARNGNPFIAFRFQDRSGAMDGMYWSATEEEIAKFQIGKVAFLRGERDNYQGTPQVKIKALRLAEVGEPMDPNLYLERTEMKEADIRAEIQEIIFKIHEPNIRRVINKLFEMKDTDFYTYPAAKRNHHAMAGGLSYHTLTMLRIGQALINIYPHINASLLLAGILIHDMGKTIELTGPISTEYSFEGKMLGHIVIMSDLINEACEKANVPKDLEAIVLLKHIILSHHGKLEFGSPVVPKILEAELIHHIDNLDATANMIISVLDKTEPGQETAQIYPLDRRSFYKPTLED